MFTIPKTYNLKPIAGFTLVELLVAMGLFLIIVSIASGIFLRSLRTERTAVELLTVNDNASLTLEQMSRELRTGNSFAKISDTELQFKNFSQDTVRYRLAVGARGEGLVERAVNSGAFEALTANNIDVKKLHFIVLGNSSGDKLQPRITIAMNVAGRSTLLKDVTTNLQITVSPRTDDE